MAKRGLGLTVSTGTADGVYEWATRLDGLPEQQELQLEPNSLYRAERPAPPAF
jgi:hypothetical protein